MPLLKRLVHAVSDTVVHIYMGPYLPCSIHFFFPGSALPGTSLPSPLLPLDFSFLISAPESAVTVPSQHAEIICK